MKTPAHEDAEKWMHENGYSMSSRCGTWGHMTFSKTISDPLLDEEIIIHCTISLISKIRQATLVGMPKHSLFHLTSGSFQVRHPQFKRLFEDRLVEMMFKLKELEK